MSEPAQSSSFDIEPISPHVGVEIRGLDVRSTTHDTAVTLAKLLLRHVVLVIRGQQLSSADHVRFSRHFGRLEGFPRRPSTDPSTTEEEWTRFVFPVSNRRTLGYRGVGWYWHTDGYFHERPTAVSIMRPVQLPPRGGETWFANMYDGYEMLPDDLKRRVDGMVAIARPAPEASRGGGLFGQTSATGVRHPLVRPHPVTGRKVLYFNSRNIAAIDGLDRRETEALLSALIQHVETGAFSYCHHWLPGDLVLWDNGGGAHKATEPDPSFVRSMERTTVVGEEYFEGAFWQEVRETIRT